MRKQVLGRFGRVDLLEGALQGFDGQSAGHLARLVPAHAVGHRHQHLSLARAVGEHGEQRVFVSRSNTAHVGCRANVEGCVHPKRGYCMASPLTPFGECGHGVESNVTRYAIGMAWLADRARVSTNGHAPEHWKRFGS